MSELIDRQALKAYVNSLSTHPLNEWDTWGVLAAIDKQPTVASPWRSMEDNGPPEEKGPYFVYAPSYRGGSSSGKESARGVMISKWTGKHWSIEVGYYKRPGCVTHWMPIEPPTETERSET